MKMKTKLLTIISVLAVSGIALIFSDTAMGQEGSRGGMYNAKPPSGTNQPAAAPSPGSQSTGTGGALVGMPITPEEAAKKYPARNGNYPVGERDAHKPSGIITSPYPPHKDFDCSKIAHGGLVLDTRVNKVFVRP
jgi:hypothetical protein